MGNANIAIDEDDEHLPCAVEVLTAQLNYHNYIDTLSMSYARLVNVVETVHIDKIALCNL